MDEPFGALDPITRLRLQTELRRLHREVGKTVIFVTHDVDEAIQMGDRIAILREGGVLAQYDTPDAILAHPATSSSRRSSARTARCAGSRCERCATFTLQAGDPNRRTRPGVSLDTTVRNAVSLMLETKSDHARRRGRGRERRGIFRLPTRRRCCRRPRPRHPDVRRGSSCVTGDHTFCWDWVHEHWGDTLGPALVQHIELTADRGRDRLRARVPARAPRAPLPRLEHPFGVFSALLYTIPSLALFQFLVPFSGLTTTTVEIALVAYTLVILFPNIVAGLNSTPAEVLEAARGMGLTQRQVLWRVELPLAVPAIIGGLRIAVVSTVAIATIAALLLPKGLGYPIFLALRSRRRSRRRSTRPGSSRSGSRSPATRCSSACAGVLVPWARKGLA